MAETKTNRTGSTDYTGLLNTAAQAGSRYAGQLRSAADSAAAGLRRSAEATANGYSALAGQAGQDYADRKNARTLLAQANGEQVLPGTGFSGNGSGSGSAGGGAYRGQSALGESQAGAELLDYSNALGLIRSAGSNAAGNATRAASSLQRRAESSAEAAVAGQEALRQQLLTAEGQRSDAAARQDYEHRLQAGDTANALASGQAEYSTEYQRQLGIACLEQGVMPTQAMLDAMGLDAATAKSFVNNYWAYYFYL